jgi:hypothetical protein
LGHSISSLSSANRASPGSSARQSARALNKATTLAQRVEGMMAAQLIAAHNAAMECYRRAMIDEQTFEGRRENLSQANKLSRTYATLLKAFNPHRGKGRPRRRGEREAA